MLPRILWVTVEPPSVDGGGGHRRQFFQIEELRKSFDVEVVLPRPGELAPPFAAKVSNRLRGRRPYRSPLDRRVLGLLRQGDVAVAAHIETATVLKQTVERHPVVVDLHNVYSRYSRQLGQDHDATRWARVERWVSRHAAALSVVSAEERDALPVSRSPVAVVEHGIDPAEWPVPPPLSVAPPRVAFFGSWNHQPNQTGLTWFLTACWPDIQAQLPGAELHLYGPGTPVGLASDVVHHGRVDDLAAELHANTCVVVPIVEGVGSRVKFIEAVASGRRVISTSLGAEGYEQAGDVFDRADDPAQFTAACVRALRGSSDVAARAARDAVLTAYSWAATVGPLAELVVTASGSGRTVC